MGGKETYTGLKMNQTHERIKEALTIVSFFAIGPSFITTLLVFMLVSTKLNGIFGRYRGGTMGLGEEKLEGGQKSIILGREVMEERLFTPIVRQGYCWYEEG